MAGPGGARGYLASMRIARYVAGESPVFGVVELAEDGGGHPDTILALSGDPLA